MATITSTAVSSSHSTLKPRFGSLATFAPAFFIVGAGAVAYPDPNPSALPEQQWISYGNSLSSRTKSVFESLREHSTEELVIAKLDSIFEGLLSSQQDLDKEDHKAIAAKLWELYQS